MALTPSHTIGLAPILLHTVLTLAFESIDDGRDITDLNMVLGVSGDAKEGQETVRYVMSYSQLDAIVCFGATAPAVGMPDNIRDVRDMAMVRFHPQLRPVAVVCLPGVNSRVWQSTETMFKAAAAIKALLTLNTDSVDLLQPDVTLTMENRYLN